MTNKIVIYNDSKNVGGHELISTQAIATLAKNLNIEIYLIVSSHNTRLLQLIGNIPNITLIEINYFSSRFQNLKSLISIRTILRIKKILNRINPDLLLILQGNIEIGSVCLLSGFFSHTSKIISYIPITHKLQDVGKYKFLGIIKDAINNIYFNIPTSFITLNEAMKNGIKNRCDSDVKIIANGIDLHLLQKTPQNEAKKHFNLNQNKFTIGLIGRIEFYHKGQDILLNVIEKYNSELKKFDFVIAGDGNDKFKLYERIEKINIYQNIKTLPWIENPSLFISAVDMIIMPSRFEGVPLVLLESMYLEKPIIGSKISGIKEFLPEECLFDYRNIDEIKDKILDNINLSQKTITKNKSLIINNHDIILFQERFQNLIISLMNE